VIPTHWATILTPLRRCDIRVPGARVLARAASAALLICVAGLAPARGQTPPPAKSPTKKTKTAATHTANAKPSESATAAARTEKLLSDLTHSLDGKTAAANELKLEAFARQHGSDEYGERASLAIGHYQLDKSHAAAALPWLDAALKKPFTLTEYAAYWHAQALRQTGRNDLALGELENFRKTYPDSVMIDQATQSYAEAAMAAGNPEQAAAELDAYPKTAQKPFLLLLRAQAREKAGKLVAAANDFQTIYYGLPLSDEARVAGARIPGLSQQLGASFPAATLAQQTARAEALYGAHRWYEARTDFEGLEGQTTGADNQHMQLRVAECRAGQGGGPQVLASLGFSDTDADGERLYALSQEYRSQKNEQQMLDAVNQIATRYPQNHWAEETFFATGNYYWVNLDRDQAAGYYRRVAEFAAEKNAPVAAWRATWVAYLDQKPDAVAQIETYIEKFPNSSYLQDALYWLGRSAERDHATARARGLYTKDVQRFPQTYFGLRAADRLKELGDGPIEPADVLAAIPDAPVVGDIGGPIPAAASSYWDRAQALRSIAFDASAELELRAGYAATQSPRLLLEAALSAIDAQHYAVGITLARVAYPQPEARKPADMTSEEASALYPLPYLPLVSRAATRNKVDPMLVAGIMRQESAFASEAVSYAGAVGLMQVLPKTAPHLARRMKLRYTRARLFDPEYNLDLGTLYLNDLLTQFGSPEAALAAYNAGEDRVIAWQGERKYSETPEFVESIPFSQTRDYVQIVLRNAAMYRLLSASSPHTVSAPGHPLAAGHSRTAKKSATRGEL